MQATRCAFWFVCGVERRVLEWQLRQNRPFAVPALSVSMLVPEVVPAIQRVTPSALVGQRVFGPLRMYFTAEACGPWLAPVP